MEYVVIKGAEVQSPSDPTVPAYNTGVIDQGATVVDFPMYKVNLDGSTVTFTQMAEIIRVGGGDPITITLTATDGTTKSVDVIEV
jgi:archaellum component FlaF (FlaF/FlaG flagellin family)